MKFTLAMTAVIAALCGPFIYDATGQGRNCRISYDTSFNGLYLLKLETCRGRLGIPREARTIARRPLFTEF